MGLRAPFYVQVLAYTVIIFGVMLWSGKSTQKTIYDSLVVAVEGNIIPVRDLKEAERFYSSTLEFRPVFGENKESNLKEQVVPSADQTTELRGFILPGGKRLFVERHNPPDSNSTVGNISLVIRVRRGIDRLYQRFLDRIGSTPRETLNDKLPPPYGAGSISNIRDRPWGREFFVADTDGNQLVFFQPNRKSGSRW